MENLALAHRPRTFDDLCGQKVVSVLLRRMVETKKVPHALLFDGPRGTGKTTTLRILAAALNCAAPPGPCGHCVSCKTVFDGTSPNLREIDAASHGLVDDIRRLRQDLLYAVTDGWRVIGLDEAHSISTAGFNALLKVLEEPPPNTIFVLLTTEPGRILDTVADRCMSFTFRRITVADIIERLTHITQAENIEVDAELLALIADAADGGMRNAIMHLDLVTRVGITTAEQYREHLGDNDPGPALLDAIRTGNPATAHAGTTAALTAGTDPGALTDALIAVLRDICILRAGGTLTIQGRPATARTDLARHIDGPTAFGALKILWDLKTRVRTGDNPRTGLDLAVALLTQVFAQNAGSPAPATTEQPAARKLTLAEMSAARR